MANSTVHLLKFNNYYNRIVKKVVPYDGQSKLQVQNFVDAGGVLLKTVQNCNFIPGDNVTTKLVINYDSELYTNPDYIFVENVNYTSRWFVIDAIRLRNGQYELSLKRDSVSENIDAISNAVTFVEKGYVDDNDNAIFNSENMGFNQIKSYETLLMDNTKCAWIVGYIASDASVIDDDNTHFVVPNGNSADAYVAGNHTDWEWYQYSSNNPILVSKEDEGQYEFILQGASGGQIKITYFPFNKNGRLATYDYGRSYYTGINMGGNNAVSACKNAARWNEWFNWSTLQRYTRELWSGKTASEIDVLWSYNNKVIQFNDGRYRVNVYSLSDVTKSEYSSKFKSSNLYSYMKTSLINGMSQLGYSSFDDDGDGFNYSMNFSRYYVAFTPVSTSDNQYYHYAIPDTTAQLQDAPYKMFCIPYYIAHRTGFYVQTPLGEQIFCDKSLMLNWAFKAATVLGGGGTNSKIYDLQILPYCPLKNINGSWSLYYNYINLPNNYVENVDYVILKSKENDDTDSNKGIMFFCTSSSGSKTLDDYSLTVNGSLKIHNECSMYRLCSPNYASVFEFSAAKNGGIKRYLVDYTYKPFNPFIQIAPEFGRLYGRDFNDNRGLILSGDFSLPIVSDAWINYQINNKNYQLAFDRQIENMEINNNYQMVQQSFKALSGTAQGAAQGAMSGAIVGGGAGAAVGGIIGGVTSGLAGIADTYILDKLQNEALDYKKDMFGYELGNIKALPNTINKVSSIVATSKFVPFLEAYTCTDKEKSALISKIKYNGMTVMRIGKLKDYIQSGEENETYIKGKLIRFNEEDSVNMDFHEINDIAKELDMGVFIKGDEV